MSGMWTSVTVEFPALPGELEWSPDTLRQVFESTWCEHAEHDPDWIASDCGEFTVARLDDGSVMLTLAGNTKYEIDGDLNAAEAISAVWPTATVTVNREWTGDGGPSTERFEYAAGKQVRAQESQLVDAGPGPVSADDIIIDTSAFAGPTVLVDMLAKRSPIAHLELTPEQARQLSADLLKHANGAEFRAANPIAPEGSDA